MWGSLLWEIRSRIGQQGTDLIVVQAWQDLVALVQAWQNKAVQNSDKDVAVVRQFASALVKAAGSISPDAQKNVGALLKERGFAL